MLGSTGSIGQSTLDVVRRHPERWQIHALTANSNVERMLTQCREFRPALVAMRDDTAAKQLSERLKAESLNIDVMAGEEGLVAASSGPEVDSVMAAIVGGAGLRSSLAAAEAGKRVLLANKESLVMSGHLFMSAVSDNGALLLPIDSEHNAIFQCMPAGYRVGHFPEGVNRVLLTGSGGPFRTRELDTLSDVTPTEACAHPNWDMGAKISVDSATMMNKGLELIEACWLFDCTPREVEILLHPQSVIHSMVGYNDGSVLAQLGMPDMRTPIAHAMAWPERIESGVEPLDFLALSGLDFEQPDLGRFPCLALAQKAAAQGGDLSCVLNAANEIAVDAFLKGQLRFTDIAAVNEECVSQADGVELDSLAAVLECDARSRAIAQEHVERRVPA